MLAVAASIVGLYYMTRCYRIKARPFWNHWQVATAFFGNALSLGSLLAGAVMLPTLWLAGVNAQPVLATCAGLLALGLAAEGIGHWAHARDLGRAEHEGGASYYVQATTFGKTFLARNGLVAVNLLTAIGIAAWTATQGAPALGTLGVFAMLAVSVLATSVVSRALFYVLVIPTTMPGAFFWKNKGFEEHARAIGLANLPQVGVAPLRH
jgi:DMSO reductase anchor subunit